jgi:hypothetical protein
MRKHQYPTDKLVPRRAVRDVPIRAVRYVLWIQDQMVRAAVSTERTCTDDDGAHENPWRPCQPSEDAEEWYGIEGIDGAPPDVGFSRPATPSVTDDLAVAGEERTG